MAETYRLRIYGDDGVTIAAEFSTDPAHARPYLVVPDQFAAQEIDLARGSAKTGGINVEIVDVRIDPADQDTGYVTSILADGGGRTAVLGRRAHLQVLIGATYENVLRGVVDNVVLGEEYSSYVFALRDAREQERKTRAFMKATTTSVLPRGVIDGFGYHAIADTWLVPPTVPIPAVYRDNVVADVGTIYFDWPWATFDFVLTDKMREVLRPNQDGVLDQIRLLWRETGESVWNIVEGLYMGPGLQSFTMISARENTVLNVTLDFVRGLWFYWPAGATRPDDEAEIEVIVGHNGTPTEAYPLHIDSTFGELLKGLYDGDFSESPPPPVQYDEAAVLALTERALARITEPLDSDDGIWKWVEENIYAPLGAAPALDSAGLISPMLYQLPPAAEELLQLDDTNCEALPGWEHGSADVINVVEVFYNRLVRIPPELDPQSKLTGGDGLGRKPMNVPLRSDASIAIFGERPLVLKPVTLSAIGAPDGEPVTGDVTLELGPQIAGDRAHQALDRFAFGGQRFACRVMRSALEDRRAGDWCIIATSWTPEYTTGERGANRLAQIVMVQVLDTAWSEVHLIDAGANNVPIGQPTLGALTVNSEGVVSIPVTAVPASGEARVDYAIGASAPAGGSADWRYAGRVDAAGTVTTPPNPSGVTVWVRARGEAAGRRPSAWLAAVSIATPSTPRVREVRLRIDDEDGSATVTWVPNAFALGVRLYPDSFDPPDEPIFGLSQDVIGSAGTYTFAADTVPAGEQLAVRVVPYPGWTGSAVAGTPGVGVEVRGLRKATDVPLIGLEKTVEDEPDADTGRLTVRVQDPKDLATALHYRTKVGGEDWSAWILETATPTDGAEYTQTVALVPGHDSFIEFRLTYAFLGFELYEYALSAGYDRGLEPEGAIVPKSDEDAAAATCSAQGDADTAAWKLKGYLKASYPGDATAKTATQAMTLIVGRALLPDDVGSLLTGLVPGTPYIIVGLPYGPDSQEGELVKAEALFGTIAPELVDGELTDIAGATATFGVIVKDPSGQADVLKVRKRKGGAEWPTVWSTHTASPAHNTEYTEDVDLVEGRTSEILFGLEYTLNGQTQMVTKKSPAFQLDFNARIISLAISYSEDDEVIVTAAADTDTRDNAVDPSIIVTVGVEASIPLDPTEATNDGEIIGLLGQVNTGAVSPPGDIAVVKAAAINPNGLVGPVSRVDLRRPTAPAAPATIVELYGTVVSEESCPDESSASATWVLANIPAGARMWLYEIRDGDWAGKDTLIDDDAAASSTYGPYDLGFSLAGEPAGSLPVEIIYQMILKDAGGATLASKESPPIRYPYTVIC